MREFCPNCQSHDISEISALGLEDIMELELEFGEKVNWVCHDCGYAWI